MVSNAKILAACVAKWLHPAISQIAVGKLGNFQFVRSLQNTLIGMGLVSGNYQLAKEIAPFVNVSVDALVEPMLEQYFGKLPDSALPTLAHNIVEKAMEGQEFEVLDGFVKFSKDDIRELKNLLDKNLPVFEDADKYEIVE